jgi:transposase
LATAIVCGDRNRPLKHIQRARIILFSAERLPVLEVAARAEISRRAVWRWQLRYAEQGVDELLRDKTCKPDPAFAAKVEDVVGLCTWIRPVMP